MESEILWIRGADLLLGWYWIQCFSIRFYHSGAEQPGIWCVWMLLTLNMAILNQKLFGCDKIPIGGLYYVWPTWFIAFNFLLWSLTFKECHCLETTGNTDVVSTLSFLLVNADISDGLRMFWWNNKWSRADHLVFDIYLFNIDCWPDFWLCVHFAFQVQSFTFHCRQQQEECQSDARFLLLHKG